MKFELKQEVQIAVSEETGTIRGRAEYVSAPPSYLVRYKGADGTAREGWFEEDALRANPAFAG